MKDVPVSFIATDQVFGGGMTSQLVKRSTLARAAEGRTGPLPAAAAPQARKTWVGQAHIQRLP